MAEGERGASSVAAPADVPAFVRGLSFEQLPGEVIASARRSLLDLIGVAAADSRTQAAASVSAYAATQLPDSDSNARTLFDSRRSGLTRATFDEASTVHAL